MKNKAFLVIVLIIVSIGVGIYFGKLVEKRSRSQMPTQDVMPNVEPTPQLSNAVMRVVDDSQIKYSTSKVIDNKTVLTNGDEKISLKFNKLSIKCESLAIVEDTYKINISANNIRIDSIPNLKLSATNADLDYLEKNITLKGDITVFKENGIENKLTDESLKINEKGEFLGIKEILNSFHKLKTMPEKMMFFDKVRIVVDEKYMSQEMLQCLAYKYLLPHLTWHKTYLPPEDDQYIQTYSEYVSAQKGDQLAQIRAVQEYICDAYHNDYYCDKWDSAHKGEKWMWPEENTENEDSEEDSPVAYYWIIQNTSHPDVARSVKIFGKINDYNSRNWVRAIEHNNTVLTFDVMGGYENSKNAPIVMDVRCTEEVELKLYKVNDLTNFSRYVFKNIGTDFIFRDYNLRYIKEDLIQFVPDSLKNQINELRKQMEIEKELLMYPEADPKKLNDDDMVGTWSVSPQKLKSVRVTENDRYDRYNYYREKKDYQDSTYFDRSYEYERYSRRLCKSYLSRASYKESAWLGNRIVEIPKKFLEKDGAYILTAEANGQKVYVPVIVNPFSMTLGRCRDGVFIYASDTEKSKPVASINAFTPHSSAIKVTNDEGVGFLKCHARGDLPIVAEKDGRIALGGFGEVYKGIYESYIKYRSNYKVQQEYDEPRQAIQRSLDKKALNLYDDQYAIVAYTDRPVYRPGQKVNFKAIVRKLKVNTNLEKNGKGRFRENDLERFTGFELLPETTSLPYTIFDAKNREIAHGNLKLNEFGTTASELVLSEEALTGNYKMSFLVNGTQRIVPDVFSVEYYRRPNIKLTMSGIPEVIKVDRKDDKNKEFVYDLKIDAKYYFGKPISSKDIVLKLLEYETSRVIQEEWERLNDKGIYSGKYYLPQDLFGGKYILSATLTDESNQTVTKNLLFEIDYGDSNVLKDVPRFMSIEEELTFETNSEKVTVEPLDLDKDVKVVKKDNLVTIKFPREGWYTVSDGKSKAGIFIYHPAAELQHMQALRKIIISGNERDFKWINLSRYRGEKYRQRHYYSYPWYDRNRGKYEDLIVLVDDYNVEVNGKIRLLVNIDYDTAKILFTMEGRTISDYHIKEINTNKKHGYHVLEIPVKKAHYPNFYLRGRYLHAEAGKLLKQALAKQVEEIQKKRLALKRFAPYDDSKDPRWCRFDVTDPNLVKGAEKLKLEITTNKKEYRPGEEVKVDIKVTDANNVPQEAELSLAAVDESVFAFGEGNIDSIAQAFNLAHPPRRFLPKTWRQPNIWLPLSLEKVLADNLIATDIVHNRIQEMAKMQNAMDQLADMQEAVAKQSLAEAQKINIPALKGKWPIKVLSLANVRSDFSETAAWIPQLKTDKNGLASTTFKLPDSLTEFRLTSVGLTKNTEIGTQKASVTVSQPISTQVFLPRFAVMEDKLLASGLIHNNTDTQQSCAFMWEVKNAKVTLDGDKKDWIVQTKDDKQFVKGNITIPANGSAKVAVWLEMKALGKVDVLLRGGNEAHADAVVRSFQVYPAGRPYEFTASNIVDKYSKIELPQHFAVENLSLSIARGIEGQALDGLEYLVEYPHGCVEQTMSRFLPAVMVNNAVKRNACTLPESIKKKLPKVLETGLNRLYNFQHSDGGWGWWEKDATNRRMSVYVMYGLAQCQYSGVIVNKNIFNNGCDYLKKQLRNNLFNQEEAAWAHLALAIVGQVDKNELSKYTSKTINNGASQKVKCLLSIACYYGDLILTGKNVLDKLEDWKPSYTNEIALKLKAQVLYLGESLKIQDLASRLVSKKKGRQWENTRATSYAIDALSFMLVNAKDKNPGKEIIVKLNGKEVLKIDDQESLKNKLFSINLNAEDFILREKNVFEIISDGSELIRYSLNANGVELMAEYQGSNNGIKIERKFTDVKNSLLKENIKVGEIIAVHVKVQPDKHSSYVLIEDKRPAGFEFVDKRIYGNIKNISSNIEFKDDKVCIFVTEMNANTHEFTYYLRAESPGISHVLPGKAYEMYNDIFKGESKASALRVH